MAPAGKKTKQNPLIKLLILVKYQHFTVLLIPHRDLMEDNTLLSSISYRLVRVCCEFKDKHKQIMKTEKNK